MSGIPTRGGTTPARQGRRSRPEEVDTCLSTRAAHSWSAPRSQVVGSCRSQGPGYERSPVPTPLISTTRQTCSFRFLKQNPPLKMYLQTFLCHRLILDIARICTFPGLAAPSPGGAALEQTLVAPEPTASAACPTEPCQALGPVASAHQGQTATFFQNLDVGCCSGKCPVGTGPAGPSGAGPSSAEPGRRRVEILGPPAASVLPEKRVRFLHTGQGGHRTATPDLTLHDAPTPTRARGSTRTGRTNGRLHNTEPETKIHDRYHECLLSTPRTHC